MSDENNKIIGMIKENYSVVMRQIEKNRERISELKETMELIKQDITEKYNETDDRIDKIEFY